MILCLDLGLSSTGWSFFVNEKVEDMGIIRSPKLKETPGFVVINQTKKAEHQAYELDRVLQNHQPRRVFAELPGGSKSARSLAHMRLITGVVIGVCGSCGLSIEWITPRDLKKATIGRENATKKEIMAWARPLVAHLGRKAITENETVFEHIADSIGVFYAKKLTFKLEK